MSELLKKLAAGPNEPAVSQVDDTVNYNFTFIPARGFDGQQLLTCLARHVDRHGAMDSRELTGDAARELLARCDCLHQAVGPRRVA